jgi:hypothetical protein
MEKTRHGLHKDAPNATRSLSGSRRGAESMIKAARPQPNRKRREWTRSERVESVSGLAVDLLPLH